MDALLWILFYGNSSGKILTSQCFIIRCNFSWISFALRCLRWKSLKPNCCCKYWLLCHTGESRGSWAPQNSNLKKGEDGLLDEDILCNQGQKEEMSWVELPQLRRRVFYLCLILWGQEAPSVFHLLFICISPLNIQQIYFEYLLYTMTIASPSRNNTFSWLPESLYIRVCLLHLPSSSLSIGLFFFFCRGAGRVKREREREDRMYEQINPQLFSTLILIFHRSNNIHSSIIRIFNKMFYWLCIMNTHCPKGWGYRKELCSHDLMF